MSAFGEIEIIRVGGDVRRDARPLGYGQVPDYNVYECRRIRKGLMISTALPTLADLLVDGKFREELRHAEDLSRERKSGPLFEGLHL
jgi:hypothetical protein